ncbi:MAG: histidine kinase [Thermoanaerobaculaceae bacterium]|jgi:signal transduction histidine kinase|nr:histidine kinase [Thermoanaerobaculaceae bacterium]
MMTRRCAAPRLSPAVGLVLLGLSTLGLSAETPKRVLIVDSFGRDVAPFSVAASSFRTTLVRELGAPVDLYEVSLELSRFDDAQSGAAFLEFLERRVRARPVDLVVPVGAPAVSFVGTNRDRLFPATPVVITGADPRFVPREFLRHDTVYVAQRVNLPGMVEDVLRMRPDTTNIAVVCGSSALERHWVSELRREFAGFAGRVEFTWLTEMSLEQVLERCAVLPPHSFIMLGMFLVDATGVPYDNDEVLLRLRRVANAPVYGYFASDLGNGTIGGRLYQDTEVGVLGARAAIRLLRGERPEQIPSQILGTAVPTYDWRELRRWGVSESRLPAGSVVRYRQPTAWQRYWPWIVAAAAVCFLEAGLILGLVVASARRRAAEAAVRDFSRRLIGAQELERSRLARELHDDVTQRLARLAIDVGLVELGVSQDRPPGAMRPVREELVRLSEDVHSLSYRLHPSILEDLGLAEALKAEAERFSQQESVVAEVKLHDLPAVIPNDTALCLFRVAQEALRNIGRHAGARTVEISMRSLDGGLHLAIQDDGVGFDSRVEDGQTSLGITSMRERVGLLGGELDIESSPGRGTTIVAWVPLGVEST